MKRLMGGLAAVAVGFLVLPVLALLPMSLSGTRWLALPPRDLSLRWYATFFTDRDWIEATLVSLRVAAGATALATAVGTLAAVGLAWGRFPGRDLVRALALSPLVVPVMVLAVSLYYVFGRAGLVGTLTGLVLAHALLGVPYVVLNVEAVMRGFDVRLERAARILGATAWQAFRRVTLPVIRPGLLAGALFAFVASLDEVVVAMFLSGTSALRTRSPAWWRKSSTWGACSGTWCASTRPRSSSCGRPGSPVSGRSRREPPSSSSGIRRSSCSSEPVRLTARRPAGTVESNFRAPGPDSDPEENADADPRPEDRRSGPADVHPAPDLPGRHPDAAAG